MTEFVTSVLHEQLLSRNSSVSLIPQMTLSIVIIIMSQRRSKSTISRTLSDVKTFIKSSIIS